MKTSRFEENLRKKLESIEPDFQEQDWLKMQASMPVKTVPSFWQNYGPWLGYGAAAATTVVMGVMYLNQSRQTDRLLEEVAQLKHSVELQVNNNQLAAGKVDTVYLYKEYTTEKYRNYDLADNRQYIQPEGNSTAEPISSRAQENQESLISYNKPATADGQGVFPVSGDGSASRDNLGSNSTDILSGKSITNSTETVENNLTTSPVEPTTNNVAFSRLDLGGIQELPTPEISSSTNYLYRKLARRIPKTSQPKSLLPAIDQKQLAKNTTTVKPESAKEKKRILPQLPSWLPLRLGVGQQWESKAKSTTIWAEAVIAKHFAINTGLAWVKLDDQRFPNDKAFWDKTRINFRKYNGGQVPPAFSVYNINMQTTVLQLPVNFLYRSNINEDLSFFAGIGTSLNLRTKQELSCDVKIPNGEFERHIQKDNLKFPAFNNANLSIGIEKRWNPIVVQVDSYLSVYQKSRPFFQEPRNIGLRVKLLYAFGSTK